MKGSELVKLLKDGGTITCRTTSDIFEECDFGDEGMVVDVTYVRDDGECHEIILDGTGNIDHNHNVAKSNYYDVNDVPCLKYFEARNYSGKEKQTHFIDDEYECGLELVSTNVVMDRYIKSGSDLSYFKWMEDWIEGALSQRD